MTDSEKKEIVAAVKAELLAEFVDVATLEEDTVSSGAMSLPMVKGDTLKNYNIGNYLDKAIADAKSATDKATAAATKATNASSGLAAYEEKTTAMESVIPAALAELYAAVEALGTVVRDNLGEAKSLTFDAEDGYMVCGQKVFDLVDGAPAEVPMAVGLMRLDPKTGVLYVSKAVTNSTADWLAVS